MGKRIVVVSLLALFFCHLMPSVSYPDSAEVLPKGRFRLGVNTNWYFPIDERYDPDGHTEDAGADFNATLNSSVFPALRLVEIAFAMPPGSANIGNSIVDFEYRFQIFEFGLQYGITDKLSAGIMIPYWKVKNHVNATVDTSNATVGKNVALNTLAPFTILGTVPLTDEDVQALLGAGLDINGDGTIDIPGYGYERFESWSENGFSDIEAGFRYQYLKTENWRFAFTGGVRFPTGEVDDPDNLVDYGLGSGAWALLFNFNHDFIGIKNLVLNGTFRYEWYLPDKEKLRVPEDANHPITANKEKVDRDLGDVIELEISGTYEFLDGFSLSLLYEFGYAMKTDISGDRGFMYDSLEDESRFTSHIGVIGLSYSTIPLFMAKKFPLPLTASVRYRNRFAGSGNVFKSQYIGVELAAYF
ncbi:MAG: transporter [Candidatus Hodarchaeota archaeon]